MWNKREPNESIKFTEEISEEKPAQRENDKTRIAEMNKEATDMDDLLDYEEDKDVGA